MKERHQAGYELGNVSSSEGPEQEATLHPGVESGAFPGSEIFPSRVVGGEWRWNSEGKAF